MRGPPVVMPEARVNMGVREVAVSSERLHIIGIDPGRQKCGLAVLTEAGVCARRCVISTERLEEVVCELVREFSPVKVVLGDRTGATDFRRRLDALAADSISGVEVHMVNEHRSSEEGRRRYLLEHRRGWRRIVPLGLQWPTEPYDDYVAEVLALRFLQTGKGE